MYRRFVKRLLDIVGSLLLLPILVLVFLVITPLILVSDPGPILYNGERLGKNGKTFKMHKFRTMKVNAPDIRNSDGTTYNAENDNRLIKCGNFLRKTSIDELPQIINVLKGDMSFVGPRPDLPDAIGLYDSKVKRKLKVLPGITGYSQAYYRNASTLEQRFDGDVYYADNISFLLDIKILIKTVEMVLLRKNVNRN